MLGVFSFCQRRHLNVPQHVKYSLTLSKYRSDLRFIRVCSLNVTHLYSPLQVVLKIENILILSFE